MTHAFQPSSENQISEHIFQTPIQGLLFIQHTRAHDERGFYAELAHIPEIERITKQSFPIKQLNVSQSVQNVIRGFHAENWNKLATVMTGSCFCAWADLRPSSPTFKQAVTMQLGVSNNSIFGSVFIEKGIGNSFCVTSGPVNYVYAVDQLYADRDTSGDVAISLFDPELAIEWPIPKSELIISGRDLDSLSLAQKFENQ